ncbi:MAG: cytochrome c3 family protein [Planctomycetota bacterium]
MKCDESRTPIPSASRGIVRISVGMVVVVATYWIFLFATGRSLRHAFAADKEPADWGSDHVGEPLPEYITGDECLFCHRATIGNAWSNNRHQRTIRDFADDPRWNDELEAAGDAKALAGQATLLLGSGKRAVGLLKPNGKYNQLSLFSAWLDFTAEGKEEWLQLANAHWEENSFADECVGCHATAVDPENRAYSALSLDCYACHGEVDVEHTKDASLALLNVKQPGSPKVVTSICAQCHLRGGKSKSLGTPYPNNFVAGDNLLRDYEYDFSPAAIEKLDPNERHIVENVRDVALLGRESVTCLTCHDVHKSSSRKHAKLEENDSCVTCHEPGSPKSETKPFANHNKTCRY